MRIHLIGFTYNEVRIDCHRALRVRVSFQYRSKASPVFDHSLRQTCERPGETVASLKLLEYDSIKTTVSGRQPIYSRF